jgi:acetyl esterase
MSLVEERQVRAGDHQVRIRLYHPSRPSDESGPRGCLVYMHGGGWTLFSLDTHDRLMREYAERSGLIVAGVDYSLSPEARFPTALDEVVQAIRWLGANGALVGVDPARLLAGGDSAGANLALAAALKLRDSGEGSPVRGLLLNYGAFAVRPTEDAVRQYGGTDYMLSAEEMAGFWTNYLRGPSDAADPLASPILADLAGLPPAFLAIAECDVLAEQNLDMARRMTAAGVSAKAVVYAGATHSFLEAVSIAPLADRALGEAGRWLGEIAASVAGVSAARSA